MTAPADPVESSPPADTDELHCPVCDYSLRALPEPRCPECGYVFEWAELIEQARRRKLWFYEHAGTFRSHWKTRWKSFWLFPFWRQVHAYSDANLPRLHRYRWATLAMTLGMAFLAPPLVQAGLYIVEFVRRVFLVPTYRSPYFGPRRIVAPPYWRVATDCLMSWLHWTASWFEELSRQGAAARQYEVAVGMLVVVALFVLPMYFAILRRSLRLAGAKPVHLARIGAYGSDVLPAAVLIIALFFCLRIGSAYGFVLGSRSMFWRNSNGVEGWWLAAMLTPAVVVLPLAFRFGWALRAYLRLPHAWGVAAGYWLIGVLFWAIAYVNVA